MNDLISRQAAIDACHNWDDGKDAYAYGYMVEERLRALPSAQSSIVTMKLKVDPEDVKKAMQDAELTLLPPEPRRGKWLSVFVDGLGFNGLMFECSECGKRSAGRTNFCAYCGADMRGERSKHG